MIEKSALTHRLTALEEYLADLGEIDKDLDRSKFIENRILIFILVSMGLLH